MIECEANKKKVWYIAIRLEFEKLSCNILMSASRKSMRHRLFSELTLFVVVNICNNIFTYVIFKKVPATSPPEVSYNKTGKMVPDDFV